MTVERSPSLATRAVQHAALSDASRLAIVDALTLSDHSPSEVGRMLGLSSNLVAHHVRVLRQAGLITQARSQGDARRTYLQLVPDALDGLISRPRWAAERVLFVCSHNSARSQLAAALWRRSTDTPAASAGTRPAPNVHPGAVAVARRHRLPMPRPRTHQLSDVLRDTDLLIALCDQAHEELNREPARRVLHWSVPDPVRLGTDDAFDRAYDQISARVQRAVETHSPRQETSS
jgi:ArsR family transcriptional regulator, arsenate/arsenite/antimonite-responsive transcriptional repressor / arsenate reductase (thioredoxin)